MTHFSCDERIYTVAYICKTELCNTPDKLPGLETISTRKQEDNPQYWTGGEFALQPVIEIIGIIRIYVYTVQCERALVDNTRLG